MRRIVHRCRAGAFVLIGALLALGCETSVDPILNLDHPYTLWGALDASADTQAVRVVEIAERLEPISPEPLDAVVTSYDLTAGTERRWEQRVVQLADSGYRHVFFSAFRVEHDHTYRLEVERSDGARSWVEVTVPAALRLREQPAMATPEIIAPVVLDGDPPTIFYTDVVYNTNTIPDPEVDPNPYPIAHPVTISYQDELQPHGDGWMLNISLSHDFPTVQQDFRMNGVVPYDLIFLRGIELRMGIGDVSWNPPGGVFDPDVLVEPGTFSNVQNGFGYVGAGYVASVRWQPDARLMLLAGFANCRNIPSAPPAICTKDDLPD